VTMSCNMAGGGD